MFLDAIKKSAGDIWEEMLYLMIFNFIWLAGSLLIIPWPFVTFGLFSVIYDISQGKGIKFGTFFAHARRMWKQAYIWGGINFVVLIILGININFYAGIASRWAAAVQITLIGLAVFWIILQLVALPLYSWLAEPSFKLALRNAAIVAGRHPLAILGLVIIVILIGLISYFFQALFFLGTFAVIAVVANRLVEALVQVELEREG